MRPANCTRQAGGQRTSGMQRSSARLLCSRLTKSRRRARLGFGVRKVQTDGLKGEFAGFGKTALGRSPCEMAGARVGASRAVDGGQPQGGDPAVLLAHQLRTANRGFCLLRRRCRLRGYTTRCSQSNRPSCSVRRDVAMAWHELDGLPQVPDRTGTECATEDGHGATARCDTGRRPAPRVLYLEAMMGTRVSRAVSGDAPVTDRQRDRQRHRQRQGLDMLLRKLAWRKRAINKAASRDGGRPLQEWPLLLSITLARYTAATVLSATGHKTWRGT